MEDNSMDLVFSKSFQELSLAERTEMRELFTTEEEFNQIKMVMSSINEQIRSSEQSIQPSPKTKERLDHLFHQTYQSKGILWYNSVGNFFISTEKKWYNQNALRIAAVLLLVLMTYPFWNADLSSEQILTAKNENMDRSERASKTVDSASETHEEATKSELEAEEDLTADQSDIPMLAAMDRASAVSSTGDLKIVDDNSFNPLDEFKTVAFDASSDDATSRQPLFATGTNHPDGIYKDASIETSAAKTVFAVQQHQSVLDLLTPTF